MAWSTEGGERNGAKRTEEKFSPEKAPRSTQGERETGRNALGGNIVHLRQKSLFMTQKKVCPHWVAEKSCNVPFGLISAGSLFNVYCDSHTTRIPKRTSFTHVPPRREELPLKV